MELQVIKINYENAERPTVSGRELHQALDIKTQYSKWFARMCEYGFTENRDFFTVVKKVYREDGRQMPQEQADHELTIPMAKELCMIQRTEVGKRCREYFLEVEKRWNSPEAIMARALQLSAKKIDVLETQVIELTDTVKKQEDAIDLMKPKFNYCKEVLDSTSMVTITSIAKDFGMTAKQLNEILRQEGIQYRSSDAWVLYSKYDGKGLTGTKPVPYKRKDGSQGTRQHTYWTEKGRAFIYFMLLRKGYLCASKRGEDNDTNSQHKANR